MNRSSLYRHRHRWRYRDRHINRHKHWHGNTERCRHTHRYQQPAPKAHKHRHIGIWATCTGTIAEGRIRVWRLAGTAKITGAFSSLLLACPGRCKEAPQALPHAEKDHFDECLLVLLVAGLLLALVRGAAREQRQRQGRKGCENAVNYGMLQRKQTYYPSHFWRKSLYCMSAGCRVTIRTCTQWTHW